ncbi:MAG TPA: ABC transporter permease [Candidatus Limnocylindria bacterium]|nr:ABC transporter permease [Candidatus Limnocylindria bacterium]
MSGIFPNALHVARREYLQRIRSRTFRIVTIGLVVIGLLLALAPVLFRVVAGERPHRVAVSVPADLASPQLAVAQLEAALNAGTDPADAGSRFQLTLVDDPSAARSQVRKGDLDGLLEMRRANGGDLEFSYVSNASLADPAVARLRQAASSLAIADRLERAGVAAEERAGIFAPVTFATEAADPTAVARQGDEFGARYLVAFFFVILNFVAIVNYGNWVASSVAEEKSSRVMELLLSAATPRQLLTGKLLGTGAAGLTQYGAMVAAIGIGFLLQGVVARALLGSDGGLNLAVPGLSWSVVLVSLLFFIGGFILYSTLYAAAGSMVSRQEDVQQAGAPLMVIAMAGYFVSFAALQAPDAGWVQIASYVPFASPYLVAIRAAFGTLAPWEVPVIAVLVLVTIVGAIWVAARIYSAGVLLYGQRLGIREVLRAARVAR